MWFYMFQPLTLIIYSSYFLINCQDVQNNDSKRVLFEKYLRQELQHNTESDVNDKIIKKNNRQQRTLVILITGDKSNEQAHVSETKTDLRPNIERMDIDCPKVNLHNCYQATAAVFSDVCKLRYYCSSRLRRRYKKYIKIGCKMQYGVPFRLDQQLKKNSTTCALSALRMLQEGRFMKAAKGGYFNKCFKELNYKELFKNITSKPHQMRSSYRPNSDECERIFRTRCEHAIDFGVREACYRRSSRCTRNIFEAFYNLGYEKCKYAYRSWNYHDDILRLS